MVPISFSAPLWLWQTEKGSWTFASLPPAESDAVRMFAPETRGFGSVRVSVTLGTSRWKTSVFPSKEQGGFILPIKKAVRTAESLDVGDMAEITIEVIG